MFKRDGDDVLYETSVSFPKATLGGLVDVPTLGWQSPGKDSAWDKARDSFQVGREGTTKHGESQAGRRSLVRVNVDVPLELTKRQRELFKNSP